MFDIDIYVDIDTDAHISVHIDAHTIKRCLNATVHVPVLTGIFLPFCRVCHRVINVDVVNISILMSAGWVCR